MLVSEIMLQQTPVARVLPVWARWMDRWPEPADLAAEPAGEAVRAWERLGYPRRALRLHRAAVQITQRHDGRVPSAHAELLALDGVGSYTAAAVASFAFGGRHAVVDTNVRRVLARAVGAEAQPPPALTRAEGVRAERLVPDDAATAARWAVAVMELGALVCTARSPACTTCPIAARCAWVRSGSVPYDGPARRSQGWHGTDRQVRGRLLAVLRDADAPVTVPELVGATPDDTLRDPRQRERALASLVEDGLLEQTSDGRYALPA
ncbi:MAG TPA: A/G-specific adenine glycosylase [Actinomycetales bacterium]